MIEDCTAIILAGGDSQRMGSDKANLLLGEQTLLQRVIATMQQVFPHVIVSVRQPRPEIDLPQVCDEQSGGGPLAGLAAGLGHIATPWAFVVACDMPFVEPADDLQSAGADSSDKGRRVIRPSCLSCRAIRNRWRHSMRAVAWVRCARIWRVAAKTVCAPCSSSCGCVMWMSRSC